MAGKSNPGSLQRGLSDLETTIAERIVDTLAPVVGADHVKSSVSIDYNPDSGETTQELYDPDATAVLTSQVSEDQTTGAAPFGIPGTTSNVPSAPPTPPTSNATPSAVQQNSAAANSAQGRPAAVTQGMRSESKTFAVSKTVHHTLEPAGQIKHLAAAVLVDDFVEVKEVSGKSQETRRKWIQRAARRRTLASKCFLPGGARGGSCRSHSYSADFADHCTVDGFVAIRRAGHLIFGDLHAGPAARQEPGTRHHSRAS